MRLIAASTAALALFAWVQSTTPTAFAGGSGGNTSAGSDDTGIVTTVTVGTEHGPRDATRGSGTSADPGCGLDYISGSALPSLEDNSTEGYWVIDTCALGVDASAVRWVPSTPRSAEARPSPAQVAQTALARATWPAVVTRLNPPPDRLLVNFPIWLHLASGWQTVSASASVGGVSATVTASPQWARWDMGDGGSVTCHTPGTTYEPDRSWSENVDHRDCGFTYTRSSARAPSERFAVSVTVHYEVSWSSTGAAGGGSLGGHDLTTTFPVAVGQLQALDD